MIKHNSDQQLTIEEFKTPFQASLPAELQESTLNLACYHWQSIDRRIPYKAFDSNK